MKKVDIPRCECERSALFRCHYKYINNISQGRIQDLTGGRHPQKEEGRGCQPCYWPKQSFGQGNIFTPVCHSVHRGGVPDQVHPPRTRYTPRDQVHPPDQVPPGTRFTPPTRYTPGPGTTPRPGTPPARYTPSGTRYTLRGTRYTPQDQVTPLGQEPPGQVHPRNQVPPPGCKLRNTVNDRPVRILLECILVFGKSFCCKLDENERNRPDEGHASLALN